MRSSFVSAEVYLVWRSQGIVGVEGNESRSVDHHLAHGETDSKKNNFTGCKYEFMRVRDAAWDECPA